LTAAPPPSSARDRQDDRQPEHEPGEAPRRALAERRLAPAREQEQVDDQERDHHAEQARDREGTVDDGERDGGHAK
jgi:hypothetical protein